MAIDLDKDYLYLACVFWGFNTLHHWLSCKTRNQEICKYCYENVSLSMSYTEAAIELSKNDECLDDFATCRKESYKKLIDKINFGCAHVVYCPRGDPLDCCDCASLIQDAYDEIYRLFGDNYLELFKKINNYNMKEDTGA